MALRGFWLPELPELMAGPVMRELVMEAIRWRGEADTLMSSPTPLLTAMEVMGVTRLPRGVAGVLRPEGGKGTRGACEGLDGWLVKHTSTL